MLLNPRRCAHRSNPHILCCMLCHMTPSIVMHVARNHISACIYVCKMNNDSSIRESSSGVFVKEKNKNIVRDEGKRQKNVNAIWIARSDIGILVVVVFYIENLVVGWRLRMHSTFRCAVHGNGLQWVAVCDSDCNGLQCVTVVAMGCSVWQCFMVWYSIVNCVATCCSVCVNS